MPKTTKTHKENREAIVISAMLTYPSIPKVSEVTGIAQSAIREMLKSDTFNAQLQEARERAKSEAITYLQGNLSVCVETLMDIVKDKDASAQVRINAINAFFSSYKILNGDNDRVVQGMAVQIIDGI